jgi:hypothetical protein
MSSRCFEHRILTEDEGPGVIGRALAGHTRREQADPTRLGPLQPGPA